VAEDLPLVDLQLPVHLHQEFLLPGVPLPAHEGLRQDFHRPPRRPGAPVDRGDLPGVLVRVQDDRRHGARVPLLPHRDLGLAPGFPLPPEHPRPRQVDRDVRLLAAPLHVEDHPVLPGPLHRPDVLRHLVLEDRLLLIRVERGRLPGLVEDEARPRPETGPGVRPPLQSLADHAVVLDGRQEPREERQPFRHDACCAPFANA
jgi:hypothetical protein